MEGDTEQNQQLTIAWRDVPTVLVDRVLAFAQGEGNFRITLGEISYNPAPGQSAPMLRPVVTVAAARETMEKIAQDILAEIARARDLA